jgi:DNA repair exonuclease SbcCD ATPase subunit
MIVKKLKEIKVKNFQLHKNLKLKPDCNSMLITATNGYGKTAIANAYLYALTGRDVYNKTDFEIKPKNGDEVIHNLVNEVELIFDDIKIKRTQTEKWSKDKLTGNTIDYYIGDDTLTPIKMSQFEADLKEWLGLPEKMPMREVAELIQIITNPAAFNNETFFDWKKRRKFLFDNFVNIKEEDIIKNKPKFKVIEQYIDNFDKKRAEFTAQKNKITNKVLPDKNSRIDQVISDMIKKPTENKDNLTLQKVEIDDNIKKLNNKIAKLKTANSDVKIEEAKKELRKLEQLKSEYAFKSKIAIQDKISNLNNYSDNIESADKKVNYLNNFIDKLKNDIETKNKELVDKEKSLLEVEEEKFDDGERYCSKCKQLLPPQKQSDIKKEFEKNKADSINNLNTSIVAIKSSIKTEEEKLSRATAELQEEDKTLNSLKKKQTIIEKTKNNLLKQLNEIDTEEYDKSIEQQKLVIEELKTNDTAIDKEAIEELNKKIAEYQEQLDKTQRAIFEIEQYEKQQATLAELETELKEATDKEAELIEILNVMKEYIEYKCSLLSDEINKNFTNVKFNLFDIKMNENISETCDCYVKSPEGNWVGWQSVNSAGKLIAGIEIINVITDKIGLKLPVMCDEYGQIVENQPVINGQAFYFKPVALQYEINAEVLK